MTLNAHGLSPVFSERDSNVPLFQANKYFGTNVTVVQKTITQPFDLQVVHPKRQPRAPNPCSIENGNGGCSDLCLIGLNGTVGCRCPHRKKLGANNKTCEGAVFKIFETNYRKTGLNA
ncbi:hypothetical protein DPMN_184341 [Dreissena polymorpha]|uniref:Uncharacterized protein n=1 Tax=Dreissena polymorpha TaxID=45954 RepID=A0A9D4DIL2_DREPO|nr:hypothetical protein DPMN_184341 [Dreissena polymorpha]